MQKSPTVENRQKEAATTTKSTEADYGPFLQWTYKFNEQTGKNELLKLELTDGSQLDEKSLKAAFKQSTGTTDLRISERIVSKVSHGMSAEKQDARLNDTSILLPALHPQDETEALLLGQFLALHDSGTKCLRLANSQDNFYHVEKFFLLANKLFNTANQTMQTVLKYRSGGQQTVQVVHVQGQAIVAQNLSSKEGAGLPGKNMN